MKVTTDTLQNTIYRKIKNIGLCSSRYGGALESPVYAILGMKRKVRKMQLPKRLQSKHCTWTHHLMKVTSPWNGMGEMANYLRSIPRFRSCILVVIIIIYMLIVGWFQNFKTQLQWWFAIPLSLVGIVLGHWVLGTFSAATSFIGMIALAGVMVQIRSY